MAPMMNARRQVKILPWYYRWDVRDQRTPQKRRWLREVEELGAELDEASDVRWLFDQYRQLPLGPYRDLLAVEYFAVTGLPVR